MSTKILLSISAVIFAFLTVYVGKFAISNIGNTSVEHIVFAISAFLAVAILSAFSFYFAICKFKGACESL